MLKIVFMVPFKHCFSKCTRIARKGKGKVFTTRCNKKPNRYINISYLFPMELGNMKYFCIHGNVCLNIISATAVLDSNSAKLKCVLSYVGRNGFILFYYRITYHFIRLCGLIDRVKIVCTQRKNGPL